MSDDGDYEVGYKKPPKEYRFPKGRSGNPGGRPKKKVPLVAADESAAAILKRVGEQTVKVAGEQRSMLELEFLALQMKASKGDVAASRQLSRLRKELGLLLPPSTKAGGVLLAPASMEEADFEKMVFKQQAKFREKQVPEGEEKNR